MDNIEEVRQELLKPVLTHSERVQPAVVQHIIELTMRPENIMPEMHQEQIGLTVHLYPLIEVAITLLPIQGIPVHSQEATEVQALVQVIPVHVKVAV